jgi:hypothetical protein
LGLAHPNRRDGSPRRAVEMGTGSLVLCDLIVLAGSATARPNEQPPHRLCTPRRGKRLDVPRILLAVDRARGFARCRRVRGPLLRSHGRGDHGGQRGPQPARHDATRGLRWGLSLGAGGPDIAAGDRATWEQAVVREQQAGEAVALAQAPADADVKVVFGEVEPSCAPPRTRTLTSSWWAQSVRRRTARVQAWGTRGWVVL